MRRRGLLSTAAITAFLLSTLPTAPASATFSGHNGRIAFALHGLTDIATMNPDGTGKQTLTSFAGGSTVEYPHYSPDGTKIVFDAYDPTNHPTSDYDIYSMTSTGAHLKQLTSDISSYDDWGGSFSPNGRKIAFISDRSGIADVWTMNADGTNPQQVTTSAAAEYTSWSPDGHWILFDSNMSGNYEIYRVHPDGTHQKALTGLPFTGSDADWSPNGNLITFSGSKTAGSPKVWVMNADGTHRHQVTAGNAAEYNTVWSPDGNWIAFDEVPFGSKGVRVVMKIRADGTGLAPLTSTASNNAHPGWQPT